MANAVVEIGLRRHDAKPLDKRLQVPPRESAVCWVALDENLAVHHFHPKIGVLAVETAVLFERHPAADIDEPILLETDVKPVDVMEHLVDDVDDGLVAAIRLVLLNEPRVLGKPAGIKEQRDTVFVGDFANLPDILHQYWLAATRVVSDREIYERNSRADSVEQRLQLTDIHVAAEWKFFISGHMFGAWEIEGNETAVFDIAFGRIEMRVAGNDVIWLSEPLDPALDPCFEIRWERVGQTVTGVRLRFSQLAGKEIKKVMLGGSSLMKYKKVFAELVLLPIPVQMSPGSVL